jgi:Flp pilus assembly protein TadD
MKRGEEEAILEKLEPRFRELSAQELSQRIQGAPKREKEVLIRSYPKKLEHCRQAETALAEGNLRKTEELLQWALSLGRYGNELPYGLLGDLYLRRGDEGKAKEYYRKSGSLDALKKLRNLEAKESI